jgi:hemerythrin-like domain-containing protein
MALAHNMFLRALNSIYLQAPLIHDPTDVADLYIFCEAWIHLIHHHHSIEESTFFSELEQYTHNPELTAREREQHKIIHEGLDQLQKYVTETAPSDYKWTDLETVFESFGSTLQTHLHEEVQMILDLKDNPAITEENILKAWEATEKEATNFSKPNMMVSTIDVKAS